jgi:hypothetical protein
MVIILTTHGQVGLRHITDTDILLGVLLTVIPPRS